jgi:hypothetical protein
MADEALEPDLVTLERAERVRFVRTAEGCGWHIHVEGYQAEGRSDWSGSGWSGA